MFRILYMRARFRENVRSERFKKIFFFPLLRVKGAEAQKNTFRVTVIFFLVSLPKNFWSSALPHFGKKKHKKKRHETRTVNQSFRLCCCSRAKKRRDVL